MSTRPRALSRRARRGSSALVAILAAVTLAACSGTGSPEADTEIAAPVAEVTTEAETTEPSPTPSPTPTPTPPPELPESPLVRELELNCSGEESDSRVEFSTLEEAWAAEPSAHTFCTIYSEMTVLLDAEREALNVAYGAGGDSLDIMYSMCAETMLGNAGRYGPKPLNDVQRQETEGALTLCPEHPDAEAVRDLMSKAVADDELRAEGKTFHSGTYLVGEEVQPGTYISESTSGEPFSGCYWELTDESGEAIDNFFSTSALRVELTVTSSAYSLTVDGCGEFRPAE